MGFGHDLKISLNVYTSCFAFKNIIGACTVNVCAPRLQICSSEKIIICHEPTLYAKQFFLIREAMTSRIRHK